jgi:glycosyltransferase involved in cell wall biosynthesis
MRLIVNTTNLKTGGALQVAHSLLQEWAALYPEHSYHVFLSQEMAAIAAPASFPANFECTVLPHHPTDSWWRALTMRYRLARIARSWKADVVFTVFGPALWRPEVPHMAGFANGYYLFDNCRFIRDHIKVDLLARIRYYLRRNLLFRQLAKEADCYWVETIAAQHRLCQELELPDHQVFVVGNTFGTTLAGAATVSRAAQQRPFRLLYLTAYYAHKNIEIIPKVIAVLVRRKLQVQFQLTLPQDHFERIFGTETAYVVNLGPQTPEQLLSTYTQADAAFIPTLLETFTAAYPEAMKMQLPVLTSDIPVARNICGDAAFYFDPADPEDIADKIAALMLDPTLYAAYVQLGLQQLSTMETPQSRAQKLMTTLQHLSHWS